MEDEFDSSRPRKEGKRGTTRSTSPRARSHKDPRNPKNDLNMTREFIDFDVIKGSALFHTKPSNHDRKLIKEGIYRVLFLPFYASFWRQKPHFYEIATALFLLHMTAICIFLQQTETSIVSTFEVIFPVCLLLLIAVEYGRVSSALQATDGDPSLHIFSPKNQNGSSDSKYQPTQNPLTTAAMLTGLSSSLGESDNSDNSTDSGEESDNVSTSSEEEREDKKDPYYHTVSEPASPRRYPRTPNQSRLRSAYSARAGEDKSDSLSRRHVKVCMWEDGLPVKQEMTVTELRNTILAKVRMTQPRAIYRNIGFLSSIILATVPLLVRMYVSCVKTDCLRSFQEQDMLDSMSLLSDRYQQLNPWDLDLETLPLSSAFIAFSCMLTTYFMASTIFSALADAEATYHRRFLYAKCFTALTSSRRSRQNNLPHFRLKNVVNIKAWIALRGGRTWLKRQGKQRAADEIVSTSFVINLVLLAVMGLQLVSESTGPLQNNLIHAEVTIWSLIASIFMLRFIMLGSHINRKYQNTSLLLTEQMNVYLRLLVKPQKKEKLLISNNVLKLASKLLKELNSPNKVSGLTMNPLLYNLTRVVVLSAFSSAASEIFGFKLKIWKMKVT